MFKSTTFRLESDTAFIGFQTDATETKPKIPLFLSKTLEKQGKSGAVFFSKCSLTYWRKTAFILRGYAARTPHTIQFTNSRKIEFVYDGTGMKLRKTTWQNGIISETMDYMGEYEYKNKVLSRIHNTEGSCVRQADGSFVYEYSLKDHLGNTRVTFADTNNDWVIDPNTEVSQINHYYPFGLNMEGNWNGQQGANKYQYNGKEWNDDFGLGWNDYGARFYDPAIGRWVAVDPLSEMYVAINPYAYVMNNPIVLIDPTGMASEAYSFGTSGFHEKDAEELSEESGQKAKENSNSHVAVHLEGNNAKSAFSVFAGQKDNVMVNVEEKNLRDRTNTGYYANTGWAVFEFGTLKEAAAALSKFKELSNLIIGAHGKNNTIDPNSDNNTNGVSSDNLSAEEVSSSKLLKDMMCTVKSGGNIVFAVCDLGKGKKGANLSEKLGLLAGKDKNVYTSTGFCYIPREKDTFEIKLNGTVNFNGIPFLKTSGGVTTKFNGNITITKTGLTIQ